MPGQLVSEPGLYENALKSGWELQQRPRQIAGVKNIQRQHQKNRMTIWERIRYLSDETRRYCTKTGGQIWTVHHSSPQSSR